MEMIDRKKLKSNNIHVSKAPGLMLTNEEFLFMDVGFKIQILSACLKMSKCSPQIPGFQCGDRLLDLLLLLCFSKMKK